MTSRFFIRSGPIIPCFCNLTLEEMNEARNRGWDHRDSRVPMLLQAERAGVTLDADPARIQAILDADKG